MKKINIAEILKDCPSGMELDCIMFDNVTFVSVDNEKDTLFPIKVLRQDGCGITLTKYGQYADAEYAKCVIFPKGKTTWEGFQRPFKDGDVVATTDGTWVGITLGGTVGKFIPTYCVIDNENEFMSYLERKQEWVFSRLATEEEKERLFKAIKDNGYCWNAKTKTLEKKKKEYPKTYEECCKVLFPNSIELGKVLTSGYNCELLKKFGELLICRDAYWKTAGWKPDWGKNSDNYNYNLIVYEGEIIKDFNCGVNHVLDFPTKEMRDAFYENFKDLIKQCKELL